MIDSFFVRPFLALFTFVKRNPLLATLLIIILFILPPFLIALHRIFSFTLDTVKRVLGIKAAEALAKVFSSVMTWMANNHWACPVFALVIGVFAPLVGGLLTAWCVVDKFKGGPELTVLPSSPAPPPDDSNFEPDLSDTGGTKPIDDYFGGILA